MNEEYKNALTKWSAGLTEKLDESAYWNSAKYHMFCSLKRLLIPDHDMDDFPMFRNINCYKDRAHIDVKYSLQSLQETTIRDPKGVLQYLQENTGIICTFHLGSYRLINSLLMEQNIDYTLVIDQNTYDKQQETFREFYQAICDHKGHYLVFDIIVADENTIGLKMIRLLKKNKNVLLYIDGNTGVGGTDKTAKMEPVSFLGHTILARKGIAALSYISDTPVLPVMSYYEQSDIVIEFLEMMHADKAKSLEEATSTLTQKIYDTFSGFLMKYPDQWEGWLYYSMFVDKSKLSADMNITISKLQDQNRFKRFQFNGDDLVYDYDGFNVFKLPASLKNEETV